MDDATAAQVRERDRRWGEALLSVTHGSAPLPTDRMDLLHACLVKILAIRDLSLAPALDDYAAGFVAGELHGLAAALHVVTTLPSDGARAWRDLVRGVLTRVRDERAARTGDGVFNVAVALAAARACLYQPTAPGAGLNAEEHRRWEDAYRAVHQHALAAVVDPVADALSEALVALKHGKQACEKLEWTSLGTVLADAIQSVMAVLDVYPPVPVPTDPGSRPRRRIRKATPPCDPTVCHAGKDGDCTWKGCPQTRDGEPDKTGRDCPLPTCPVCHTADCDGTADVCPGPPAPSRPRR